MSEQDAAQLQQRFRDAVAAHWAAIRRGNSDEAEQHTETLNAVVTDITDRDKPSALLALLDESERAEVRAAAATYALHHGYTDEALPVLRTLADNDDIGLVAEDADLALTEWRRRSRNSE